MAVKKKEELEIEKPKTREASFLQQTDIEDLLKEQKYRIILKQKKKYNNVKAIKNLNLKDLKIVSYEKILNKIRESELNDITSEQRKKYDEIEMSVSKQKSKKSKYLNLIFFILNLVIVACIMAYQLTREDFGTIEGLRLNPVAILEIILFFVLVIFFETMCISYLVKQSTGKWKLGLAYKVTEVGRYYDNVTPMATGGQPFQITYLKNRGVPFHTALSIPMAKYVFSQIAWVIVTFVCLIISFTNKSYGTFVSITSVLGFVLSFIVLFVTVFLSVCKTVGKKLVVNILKLLKKMKIVKNYEKQYERISKYISDFQDVMKQYAKSPKDFLIMTFFSLCRLMANYSIPFFIVKLFLPSLDDSMYLNLFVMSVLVDLSASFFPLPGGTGMNEISFTAAFGSIINSPNLLVWVLLIWRFFSYYIYLLQGICILSYDVAYGNKKYKWEVRRNNLAEESMLFKQRQIDRFRHERSKRRKNKNIKSIDSQLFR